MTLSAGTQLGAFEITGTLGVGGMGEVYRATDTKLGRDVAIKTLPAALSGDTDRLARFEREAKLLASLNHAHIAAVYGLDEHDGTQFIAMELVEGESLEDKLKTRPLPIEPALRLALQIAEALEAAHDKGVVHRDLKPANVMVTGDGIVKVLDFGLAKPFSGDPNAAGPTHSPALSMAMTQQGLILGTAGYMSPEQASGQATDQRADVWAFGVVLHEMLTGLPLFSGESVPHVLAAVLQTEPDWSRLPKDLHPRLKLLLERCLAKEPRNRLHSIADARIEIEAALGDPDGLTFDSAVGAAGRRASNALHLVTAVAITAVLAAVAAGAASWYWRPAESAQVTRFEHELPGASFLPVTGLPVLAMSGDGRRIAYTTSDGVYLHSVEQLEARLVGGTEQFAVRNVMLSPNGEWLGYVDQASYQLFKLRIGGGGAAPLTTVAYNVFVGGSWTDDDWIVFAEASTIKRVSANGGEPETLLEIPSGNAWLPQMLPDGRAVLYSAQSEAGNEVVVRSLEADELEASIPGNWARYMPGGYVVYVVDDSLYARRFDSSAHAFIGGPILVVEDIMPGAGLGVPFDVSESGSLVYLPAAAFAPQDRTLAIASPDGSVQELGGVPQGRYSSPRVSPDGAQLAVQTTDGEPLGTQEARIWVYDLSGETALRPLTSQSGKNFHPIWTPDSERVTFSSDRDGPVSIYWQAADGSGVPQRLTTAEAGTEHWPDTWSPDGRTLVYQVVSQSGDYDLWILSLDSPDAPRPLIDGVARQHGAAFSPNGRWIAYASNQESLEANQIYVQPFPTTGERYQITRESGSFPVWSPDGTSLFYRRQALNTAMQAAPALMQVEVVGGERFAWRNERRLTLGGFLVFAGMRDYDVLPDGQRFVMLLPAGDASDGIAERPRVHIVLNWVEELKGRLPTG